MSLQAMSPAPERPYTTPQPDFTRYKLLEVERAGFVHHRELGPVHGVAGGEEVADADHPLAGPSQEHEVFQQLIGIVGVIDEHRWAAVDEAHNEPQMRPRGIVAEIRRHALLPVDTQPVD